MAVACVAIHPTKPVLVTGSDDRTWKMWSLPRGDLIMSGEGHSDWLSDVDFHPHVRKTPWPTPPSRGAGQSLCLVGAG